MVKALEQMRYDNKWNACINQWTDKTERNRACKLKSRYSETTMLLAEAKPTRPLAEARRTLPLEETGQHCLSQRRRHIVFRRDKITLLLAEAGRKTKENKLLFPHNGTRDAFELIRICWTLKTKCREQGCFPIDSQLTQEISVAKCVAFSQRLAVTTEQTVTLD